MARLFSWNVNGIRSLGRRGFLDWLERAKPDVLCLQETKARPEDLTPALLEPPGYYSLWQPARRPVYSGVAAYVRRGLNPRSVGAMGVHAYDDEGRVQVLEFSEFTVVNAYWPNSRPERARLDYKLDFVARLRRLCNALRRRGDHVVICGDYNIAHKEIDLARPNQNRNNPGFYPEECAAMDTFVRAGYVDTFRHFTKDPGHYTWWSYRTGARERNVGWRLDYHCVSRDFLPRVVESRIHCEVPGSDHCPVSITVK